MATPSTSSETKRKLDANATSPPESKKSKSTTNYIHEELFLNGFRSDITIRAMGKEWKLHKCLLCKSKYFDTMFSDRWNGPNEEVITITVPDDVNERALQTALSSFYSDSVPIPTENVLSILSAATFLQLELLIGLCKPVMKELIDIETVFEYVKVAEKYTLQDIKEECFSWLDTILLQPEKNILMFKKRVGLVMLEELLNRPTFIVRNEPYLFQIILSIVSGVVAERKKEKERPVAVDETGAGSKRDGDGAEIGDEENDEENLEDVMDFSALGLYLHSDEVTLYRGLLRKLRLQRLLEDYSWQTLSTVFEEMLVNKNEKKVRSGMPVQTWNRNGPKREEVSDQVFTEHCIRCGFYMDQKKLSLHTSDVHPDFYSFYDFSDEIVMNLTGKDKLGWNCGSELLLVYSKM